MHVAVTYGYTGSSSISQVTICVPLKNDLKKKFIFDKNVLNKNVFGESRIVCGLPGKLKVRVSNPDRAIARALVDTDLQKCNGFSFYLGIRSFGLFFFHIILNFFSCCYYYFRTII